MLTRSSRLALRLPAACLLATMLGVGAAPAAAEDGPIQDNSFLIEEAYNQEAGVVQHINTFQAALGHREWAYSFTQEWPVTGIDHQLSYTIPMLHPQGGRGGVGDIALNYRYQLLGDGDAPVAISPRLTLLVPTGSVAKGRGNGHLGYQFNLPVSVMLSDRLAAHSNVGYTLTPKAKDGVGSRADLHAWNFGQSVIWLVDPTFNFMLEAVYVRGQSVAGPGMTERDSSAFVSPGFRKAFNFSSGLQIVAGVAVPVGIGPSRGEKSVFLYLSFEHPF